MRLRHPTSWKFVILRHLKALVVTLPLILAVIGALALWGGEEWRQRNIDHALLFGLHWLFILHLFWQILEHECPQFYGIPEVKVVRRTEKLLLVEKSPWIGVGVMTTIYVLENEFERLVCHGEVVHIQMNNMAQIRIHLVDDIGHTDDDVWQTFERIDKDSILIKPGPLRGIS